jgi:hypothetical protein
MLTASELLAAAKAAQGIPSNYRLARVLGVPESTVQRWNTRRGLPSDEYCAKLADLAGLDRGEVVAWIRAERETDPYMRDVWASVAKRLHQAGSAAMAVILSLCISGGPDGSAMAATPGAQQQTAPVNNAGNTLNIVALVRFIARICRLLPPLIAAPQPA